ncbi:hypothetical protein Prum_017200 [Phytohabitans rumicis]|uniref:HTH marR-type domain-containing protein n=1 Tax=Phytohabitans rumicis TaxID=1076125 RepID=A0A6V8KZD1_9ACTN|nr:hypothetical protein Prum_017200 [Phytohabitans rumicis]
MAGAEHPVRRRRPHHDRARRPRLPAPATLTKLVDHLVDDNLVYRRIDPIDRRRIRAYLTARGRATHDRIDSAVRAAWSDLGTSDDALLAALLTRLVDALSGAAHLRV